MEPEGSVSGLDEEPAISEALCNISQRAFFSVRSCQSPAQLRSCMIMDFSLLFMHLGSETLTNLRFPASEVNYPEIFRCFPWPLQVNAGEVP
jgi:hypothetical protein